MVSRLVRPAVVPAASTDPGNAWGRGLAWYQSNTGVPSGTSLTTTAGFTASTPGATYEALDFTGHVYVSAANVTFRNCRFNTAIDVFSTGVLFTRCTMNYAAADNGLWGDTGSWTARACNLTGGGEHFRVGSNVTIEDCWTHAMTSTVSTQHNENIMSGSGTGIAIRRNWIDSDGTNIAGGRVMVTGGLNMSGFSGTFSGWTVEGNHFTGDGYLLGPGLGGPDTYRDNTFDTSGPGCSGAVYPMTLPAGDTWTNNTLVPSGTSIPRPGS